MSFPKACKRDEDNTCDSCGREYDYWMWTCQWCFYDNTPMRRLRPLDWKKSQEADRVRFTEETEQWYEKETERLIMVEAGYSVAIT